MADYSQNDKHYGDSPRLNSKASEIPNENSEIEISPAQKSKRELLFVFSLRSTLVFLIAVLLEDVLDLFDASWIWFTIGLACMPFWIIEFLIFVWEVASKYFRRNQKRGQGI